MISSLSRDRRWPRIPILLRQHLLARPLVTWVLFAAAFVVARLALLPVLPVPEPRIHDEFSYLLAADTFAHGHLAGPALAHPAAFESPHILVAPVYASKYPPGQGLVLAAGQRFFGHPYAGVLLSAAALIFLICWSAHTWLPPQWAFVAGGLAWILLFVRSYWTESYWGGSVAACGGALVLGALGSAIRRRWRVAGAALAAGATVLYLARPFEGAVLCLTAVALLLWRSWQSDGSDRRSILRLVLAPLCVIVAFVLAPLALWYNSAVTGDPLVLPYALHVREYGPTKFLWIQAQNFDFAPKTYSSERLRSHYEGERNDFLELQAASLPKTAAFQTARILIGNVWIQFYGFTFFLFLLPWTGIGGRWRLLAVLLLAGFVTLFVEVWVFPHYSAPFAAAQFTAMAAGLRSQWYRIIRSRLLIAWIAIAALMLTPIVKEDAARISRPENKRADLIRELQAKGGRHLVLVDYAREWSTDDEWVYNGYDLELSSVLFAHLRSDRENQELLRSFPGRTAWRLTLGPKASDIRLAKAGNLAPVAAR